MQLYSVFSQGSWRQVSQCVVSGMATSRKAA